MRIEPRAGAPEQQHVEARPLPALGLIERAGRVRAAGADGADALGGQPAGLQKLRHTGIVAKPVCHAADALIGGVQDKDAEPQKLGERFDELLRAVIRVFRNQHDVVDAAADAQDIQRAVQAGIERRQGAAHKDDGGVIGDLRRDVRRRVARAGHKIDGRGQRAADRERRQLRFAEQVGRVGARRAYSAGKKIDDPKRSMRRRAGADAERFVPDGGENGLQVLHGAPSSR